MAPARWCISARSRSISKSASSASTRKEVHLTPNEYKLLQVLIQHAGKVLTQRQLLNEVWGPQHTEQAQYLRVYIAQLRRKLERNPARPKYLQTEPGVGYRLVPTSRSETRLTPLQ